MANLSRMVMDGLFSFRRDASVEASYSVCYDHTLATSPHNGPASRLTASGPLS